MQRAIGLTALLFFMALTACNHEKGFTINAHITGFPDSTKIYLSNMATQQKLDSALVIDNKFVLKGHFSDPPEMVALLSFVQHKGVNTVLLLGNDHLSIEGNIRDFPDNLKYSGSRTQQELDIQKKSRRALSKKNASIYKKYFLLSEEDRNGKPGKELLSLLKNVQDSLISKNIEFAKKHINTYAGIIQLGFLKKRLPVDTVRALYNKIKPELKASKYARVLKVFLNEKIAKTGDMFHDFEAFNQKGEKVKFSSLTGKYILLDFSSAFCGPCIQSIGELHEINRVYKDSLKIIGFSQDASKDAWLKGLKRDSVSWVSLWDGKGMFSETSIKYGVEGIPSFFLINPRGQIIDTWGGYGKGLIKKKIEKYLHG